MCGIAGFIGKSKAVDNLLPMLAQMEYRGYDCLHPDTMIQLSDGRIKAIQDVEIGDCVLSTATDGLLPVVGVVESKNAILKENIYRIRTSISEIESSAEHRFFVYENNKMVEKKAGELTIKDEIIVQRRVPIVGSVQELPKIDDVVYYRINGLGSRLFEQLRAERHLTYHGMEVITGINGDYIKKMFAGVMSTQLGNWEKLASVFGYGISDIQPMLWEIVSSHSFRNKFVGTVLTPELAQILGYLIGDGSKLQTNNIGKIKIEDDKDTLEYYGQLFNRCGLQVKVLKHKWKNCWQLRLYSAHFGKILERIAPKLLIDQRVREIPEIICKSDIECVRGFIRGIFDAEGSVGKRSKDGINLCMFNENIIRQLRLLLLRFGVLSSPFYETREGRENLWKVGICNYDGLESFASQINFGSPIKASRLSELLELRRYQNHRGLVRNINEYLACARVRKIGIRQEDVLLYDISVPQTGNFIANGVVSHNSAGVATVSGGKTLCLKNVGHLAEALPKSAVDKIEGQVGIGHTRWATHGEVTAENAHPMIDCTGKIALVHNGVIDNHYTIRESLKEHTFRSETDTEVIVHLIESFCNQGIVFDVAVVRACAFLEGSFAIVAIHSGYPNRLVVARRDSPVLFGKKGDSMFVASDPLAFNGRVEEYIECPDDSVVVLTDHAEQIADTHGNIVEKSLVFDKALEAVDDTDKGGYAHYMLKEIMEQPQTFKKALKQDKNVLYSVAMEVLKAHNVILTGCGTSRYACIIGRYLMSSLGSKISEVIVGSELHYFTTSMNTETLIIAVSQSGETADVLQGVRLAKEKGAKIVSIINRSNSSLERISDTVIPMKCGVEIGVASTKAFTAELAVFYLLAYTMANQLESGLESLRDIPRHIKDLLKIMRSVKKVAWRIKDSEHIYYIGKGINFAVAGECSLKLKEISYIHAESMAGGELKHGTLSLITDKVPVIGICPDDNTHNEIITNLSEAKARHGLIIGISDKNNPVYNEWLRIPKVNLIYYPVMTVIVGQLLAYYTAVGKGLDADRPRNLAKSVTVL